MGDPAEGVAPDGTIMTGARRDRVPELFEPVLNAAIKSAGSDVSLYVYGSVSTGMAQPGRSDVDILTIGLGSDDADVLAGQLSQRFLDRCRSVEIAVAQPDDFDGDTDEAYGGRVFLRHYCVHISGPARHAALPQFPADARAARGFNGDIARHVRTWRAELEQGANPTQLAYRVGRKSLLAVAGLVSVHDGIWTTDRAVAALRWSEVCPALAHDLATLLAWGEAAEATDRDAVETALAGVVASIVASFRKSIGLWPS